MRIYYCSTTAIDCEQHGVVIASSEEEAIEKFKDELDAEGHDWYSDFVYVSEVEFKGFKVTIEKL